VKILKGNSADMSQQDKCSNTTELTPVVTVQTEVKTNDTVNVTNDVSGAVVNNVNNTTVTTTTTITPVNNAIPANTTYNINQELGITIDQINKVVDGMANILNGKKLTVANILIVASNLILITAKMALPGNLKKKVLVTGMEKYINDSSDYTPIEKEALCSAIETVDGSIDMLVHFGKASGSKCCLWCC
jgi:hypothetical protein